MSLTQGFLSATSRKALEPKRLLTTPPNQIEFKFSGIEEKSVPFYPKPSKPKQIVCLYQPQVRTLSSKTASTSNSDIETFLYSTLENRSTSAFLDFESAKSYIQSRNLGSQAEWKIWCQRGLRPKKIPSNPDRVYDGNGWESWPDFLGYTPFCEFLPFEEARTFMQKQHLESRTKWMDWCGRGLRPDYIPSRPDHVYKGKGWQSWHNWLGFEPISEFLPFEESREYMRGLNMQSTEEWAEWSASGGRPNNIPSNPSLFYEGKGWVSYADWLGYGIGQRRKGRRDLFLPFEEARAFMHTQNLNSAAEWREWCRQGERPPDIPGCPNTVYKGKGWKSFPDFLGYKRRQKYRKRESVFLKFEQARVQVRSLGLKSLKEWQAWSAGDMRPKNIPCLPSQTYANQGWISYPDWMGYGIGKRPKGRRDLFLPFEEARSFMHTQNLGSHAEWKEWRQLGLRPDDIPSNPDQVYREVGWESWPNFLGYSPCFRFLPFEEAREYVRGLGLRSQKEWAEWRSSPARPKNIPANPFTCYADEGWVSYPDWMGYAKTEDQNQEES